MCLAVPGNIQEITVEDPIIRTGKVNFGGIVKEVNLAFVPEADPGDYVIVHAGFAISRLDEREALKVLADLQSLEESMGDDE